MGQPKHRNGLAHVGLVPMSQLATGTPDGTKFVRDDNTLAVPAGVPGTIVNPMIAIGDMIVGKYTLGADAALGATATSSGNQAGQPPSLAVDGNDATYWQATNGGAGQWLRVDLGSALQIGGFRVLTGSDAGGYPWELQSSTNDATWTPRFVRTTGYDVTGQVLVTARYWRVYMPSSFGEAYLLNTLSLFATANPGTPARLPYVADGDVMTGIAGSPGWAPPAAPAAGSIPLTALADQATATFVGRTAAGTGPPSAIAAADVRTAIGAGTSSTSVATDSIWDAAGDLAVGTGPDTAGRLALTVPAANILEVFGVVNGETTPTWKAVHDATAPAAIGTAAAGTALTAAHRDHVHATGAGTPSTQAFGDAAAIGTGPAAAMTDHKHGMPTAPTFVGLVPLMVADLDGNKYNVLADGDGNAIMV